MKLALSEGHSVRALARSANTIRLLDPKLEKLEGDALDSARLNVRSQVLTPSFRRLEYRQTRN